MKTRFLKTTGQTRQRNIRLAAKLIHDGDLVAFPTETVYGLGASVYNERAVSNIFQVKGRPPDNPMIVHIWSLDQMWGLAESIPLMFWILAEKFWPGPLTMVTRKSDKVPAIVSAGLPTVAVRMPDHPVARALLKNAAVPIVAPSANLSGRPSPTMALHVLEDLDGKIAAILDGGSCKIGLESTVLDITRKVPVILRPGGVTREEIERALGIHVSVASPTRKRPASPGMKYKHYAPKAEVILIEGERGAVLRGMKRVADRLKKQKTVFGVMAERSARPMFKSYRFFSLGSTGATGAARNLFEGFRKFDHQKVEMIVCEGFPDESLGSALMNRLRKAASRRVRV